MTLTLPSFAKINWTLEILGKRPDGYHEIRTLLQTISLCDQITFTEIDKGIEIECDNPQVPLDETNLAHRAAGELLLATGIKRGIRITIEKHIPIGAGLGGGSSNAAVTLFALNSMFDAGLDDEGLYKTGSKLGSDVPFFFTGGTGLGIGRGEEVHPVNDINESHLLLVNPGVHVSAGEAYSNFQPVLTNSDTIAKMPLSLQAAREIMQAGIEKSGRIYTGLHNDLEIPVCEKYPLIREIKNLLKSSGACGVLMSGSGSTVFAIFDSERATIDAENDLSKHGWWCVRTRTLGREEYKSSIQQAMEGTGIL